MRNKIYPKLSEITRLPCNSTAFLYVFVAQCSTERGYANVSHPSIHPSIRPSVCLSVCDADVPWPYSDFLL